MPHGRTIGFIPARIASSRLPRKLLLSETGKPLLQYAWEAAARAAALDVVLIATDSPEIADVARGFGAQVELTRDHPSGSDRIAEVVERIGRDCDLVVNIQGDEPEVDPGVIDRLVESLRTRPHVEMATLATPITSLAVLQDLSCVKVVCAADGRALYFSRLPIPYYRDGRPEDLLRGPVDSCQLSVDSDERGTDNCQLSTVNDSRSASPWLLHLGLYAYRREFLLAFTKLPRSKLEQLESLEQLRALEAGASIYVEVVGHRCVGIDTAEDYARFVERQRSAGRTSKSARS